MPPATEHFVVVATVTATGVAAFAFAAAVRLSTHTETIGIHASGALRGRVCCTRPPPTTTTTRLGGIGRSIRALRYDSIAPALLMQPHTAPSPPPLPHINGRIKHFIERERVRARFDDPMKRREPGTHARTHGHARPSARNCAVDCAHSNR